MSVSSQEFGDGGTLTLASPRQFTTDNADFTDRRRGIVIPIRDDAASKSTEQESARGDKACQIRAIRGLCKIARESSWGREAIG